MRVKAKHNVKYDGVWHRTGEEFEISLTDADRMANMVDSAEEPLHAEADETEKETAETAEETIEKEPKPTGRGRKKADA
jgi:hypothetical protein